MPFPRGGKSEREHDSSLPNTVQRYLDRHFVVAHAGVVMALRLRDRASDEDTASWNALAAEIKTDHTSLRAMTRALGLGQHLFKDTFSQMRRAVPSLGQLTQGRKLTHVLDCETLILNIEAKRLLCSTLLALAEDFPALRRIDLAQLDERARDQGERVEELLLRARAKLSH